MYYKYVAFFNLTTTYGTIKGPKSTADNKTILGLIIEFLPSQIVQTHWEFCPQFVSYVYYKTCSTLQSIMWLCMAELWHKIKRRQQNYRIITIAFLPIEIVQTNQA